MHSSIANDSNEHEDLLRRAEAGDRQALGELLALQRDRLRRMVHLRMDRRLQGRVDASDVIQEAFLEASLRFEEYTRDKRMPFFLWLRLIAGQKLLVLHRRAPAQTIPTTSVGDSKAESRIV